MNSVDPAFESNVISLLKGIYDNIGSKPYDIISGFFRPVSDGVNWDIELIEAVNETGLILEKGAIEDGYVELIILNAFDEGSPYSNTQVQVINSSSMHPTNLVTCQIINDDPDLVLQYQSINSDNLAADSRGLGYEKEYPFSFEIRLYKA
jgi:hypothetical protein